MRQFVGRLLMLMSAAALAASVVLSAVVPADQGFLSPATAYTINTSAGDQFDAHIDGLIASYTSDDDVRYYNFFSGSDLAIPKPPGAIDRLSGVSGNRIVFSREEVTGRSPIFVFDTTTASEVEIAPEAFPQRTQASIGGTAVAFIDLALTAPGDLVADDPVAGTVRITADSRIDRRPSVAPSGNLIVYESCLSSAANCDIRQAGRVGTGWVVTNLTDNAESEANADTDDTWVVYDANRSGERDIFWQPVGGGAEQRLELAGVQRNPSVSGGLVTFESVAVGETTADVFAYQIATNRLFRITLSPSADESLNDVSALSAEEFNIVFSRGTSPSRDVFGVTVVIPSVVDPLDFSGFLQPVDAYPTFNVLKAGASVPVKFSLGGFHGLNIFATGFPKSQTVNCGSSALESSLEQTASPGASTLSYDAATDQYTYVWKTDRSWSSTCRQLAIQFTDLSTHYANFKLK